MGQAIALRSDFDGAALRRLARFSKSAPQARRLLALAQIYDGGSRSDAARIGGVTLQIVRDWVIRFNTVGPDGLLDGKAPGRRSILNDDQRRALVEVVERGPIPAIHGVVRWRLIDLVQWLHEEFSFSAGWYKTGRRTNLPQRTPWIAHHSRVPAARRPRLCRSCAGASSRCVRKEGQVATAGATRLAMSHA